jgi:DNA-binding CsgD family transcriptional regulator
MHMTGEEARCFANFAEAAVCVTDKASFQELVRDHVTPLVPHGFMLAVIGQLHFDHLTVHHHIGVNYPDWALAHVTQPVNIRERPLLQRWLHTRAPVIACTVRDRNLMSEREIVEATLIGMGRLALHGLPDLTSRMGSYFSFANVATGPDDQTLAHRLRVMTPLLHVALFQATRDDIGSGHRKTQNLTPIESELLKWLAAGRTNEEMASLRQRSPATIRNQLAKLYAKLGVATRAEAVALALSEALNVPDPGGG